jgi:hypothetical protein
MSLIDPEKANRKAHTCAMAWFRQLTSGLPVIQTQSQPKSSAIRGDKQLHNQLPLVPGTTCDTVPTISVCERRNYVAYKARVH